MPTVSTNSMPPVLVKQGKIRTDQCTLVWGKKHGPVKLPPLLFGTKLVLSGQPLFYGDDYVCDPLGTVKFLLVAANLKQERLATRIHSHFAPSAIRLGWVREDPK